MIVDIRTAMNSTNNLIKVSTVYSYRFADDHRVAFVYSNPAGYRNWLWDDHFLFTPQGALSFFREFSMYLAGVMKGTGNGSHDPL